MNEDAKDFKILATWPHVARGDAQDNKYAVNWEAIAEQMAAWAQEAFNRHIAGK